MVNKFFIVIVFFGTSLCMQNGHASALSFWDMSPQEVCEKNNQHIMNIETPVPTIFSVINHRILWQDEPLDRLRRQAVQDVPAPNDTQRGQESFNKQMPELIFRPQTPEEAFSFIEYFVNRLSWFKENGYNIALPIHPQLELWYQNVQTLSENDKGELKKVFVTQIYDERAFDLSLVKLNESQYAVNEGVKKLSTLAKHWDFDLKEKYTVVLTLYGPGGSYNASSGTVILSTTENGEFRKKCVAETILHEMIHIGIEASVVQKYKLTHWEKEGLVDLICYSYLNEVLPEYRMQLKGDRRIDDFVNEHTIIYDLPSAIAKFVEQYPR